eukprot:Tamp_13653.p1 GENE.Tamp_13653~~Tamp_13653.p1  ORF type:complete len:208 (+),score=24.52 Tamp_13653:1049-1672(+)
MIMFFLTLRVTTDACQRCASRRERSKSPERGRSPIRDARSNSPHKVGAADAKPKANAASKSASKKSRLTSKSPQRHIDERVKLKAYQTLLPVVCKVGALTLGKFNDDSRRKLFMCIEDDGTAAGGFLRAVCGSRYKVSPDLAVGGRASPSLIGALEKIPEQRLQDVKDRAIIFAKMVEDCALSASQRPESSRMFTIGDVVSAVSAAR